MGWRAGTTTLCQSWLYPPVIDLWIRLLEYTLIKKKIKFSAYRKSRVEQLRSHLWLTASSYKWKYLRISSYIRKPFLIYDFATAPLWISPYMRKILFSFLSVHAVENGWEGRSVQYSPVQYKANLSLPLAWIQMNTMDLDWSSRQWYLFNPR